eukprot:56384-Hanusia_phi.AAC.3
MSLSRISPISHLHLENRQDWRREEGGGRREEGGGREASLLPPPEEERQSQDRQSRSRRSNVQLGSNGTDGISQPSMLCGFQPANEEVERLHEGPRGSLHESEANILPH